MWPRTSASTGRVARQYASTAAVASPAAAGPHSTRRAPGAAASSTPNATHTGSTGSAITAQAVLAGPQPPPAFQTAASTSWCAPSSTGSAATGRSRARRTRSTHTPRRR
ncbi:hypothetical protein M444_30920 [Streptomyces sp. Mg1]|nr:hypothetical protein M444_30920 [Streptomyces sp. Mg1]